MKRNLAPSGTSNLLAYLLLVKNAFHSLHFGLLHGCKLVMICISDEV